MAQTTHPTAVSVTKETPSRVRRAPAPSASKQAARPRTWTAVHLISLALTLILGIAIGAVVVRQRQRAKEVVFAVNGTVIDQQYFYHRLEVASGPEMVRKILQEELLLEFLKKKGMLPTEAKVNAQFMDTSKDSYVAILLAASGITQEDVKRAIRIKLGQDAVFGQGVTVNEADIQAFYSTNIDPNNPKAAYYTPESVTIAVIVTQTEEEGKKALTQLHHGIAFATVAKTYSKDVSNDKGGVLPPIQRGRTKVRQIPGLEETLFGLKINEQIGPRKFAGAWWIIQCLDKNRAITKPLAEVKEQCRQGALLTKGIPANSKKTEVEFTAFQSKANVQAFWQQYKPAVRLK